jgi:hypothetical protein
MTLGLTNADQMIMFNLKNIIFTKPKKNKNLNNFVSDWRMISMNEFPFKTQKLLTYQNGILDIMGSEKGNTVLVKFKTSTLGNMNLSRSKMNKEKRNNEINKIESRIQLSFSSSQRTQIIELKDFYIFVRYNVIISLKKSNQNEQILFGDQKSNIFIKDMQMYLNHLFIIYSNKLVILPVKENEYSDLSIDYDGIHEYVFNSFALIDSLSLSCNCGLIVLSGFSDKIFER